MSIKTFGAVIGFMCLMAGLISMYLYDTVEIGDSQYSHVLGLTGTDPDIRLMVASLMDDGKLTQNEFNLIYEMNPTWSPKDAVEIAIQ